MLIREAFAQESAPATESATGAADGAPYQLTAEKMMMDNLFILGALFFIFYFVLIRPQQKRLKAQRDMLQALQKGNKIMTTGGIVGTVIKFEGDDIIILEIAPNVRIRVARSAVSDVMSDAVSGANANDN